VKNNSTVKTKKSKSPIKKKSDNIAKPNTKPNYLTKIENNKSKVEKKKKENEENGIAIKINGQKEEKKQPAIKYTRTNKDKDPQLTVPKINKIEEEPNAPVPKVVVPPKKNNLLNIQKIEPDTEESDIAEDEDAKYMEIVVGDEYVPYFKKIHFEFMNIEILKEKREKKPEKILQNVKRESGYGDKLNINKKFKKVAMRTNLDAPLKNAKSMKSIKSGVSFRATLNESKNPFRLMTLSKIKQCYRMQILLGTSIIQQKAYFGCLSSCFLPYYRKIDDPNDIHFLRKPAHKMEYNDDILETIQEKVKLTDNFKQVHLYNAEENMALDERVREARLEMDNFEVDQYIFEEFYGKKLPISEFDTK
jgi:hypothetical protein